MPVKFEQNRMVQTTQNWAFWQKKKKTKQKQKQKKNVFFYNHFWQRVDAIFDDVSEIIA